MLFAGLILKNGCYGVNISGVWCGGNMADFERVCFNRKLIYGIICTVLFGSFLATNILTYSKVKDSMRIELVERSLPLASQLTYSNIRLDLSPLIVSARSMASDEFMRGWVQSQSSNVYKLTDYLKKICHNNRALVAFLAADYNKKYYSSFGNILIESKDDSDADWYYDLLESKDRYRINVTVDTANNNVATIFINYKMFDDAGKVLGITGVGFELKRIPQLLNAIGRRYRCDIFLSDEQGNIFTTSGAASQIPLNLFNLPVPAETVTAVLDGKQDLFTYAADGINYYVHAEYVPELKWWLFTRKEDVNTLSKIDDLLSSILLINFISIIFVLVLILCVIHYVHKRLNRLATEDSLTGICNRQMFEYDLEQAVLLYKRNQQRFSLLMLDIDYFKQVNDTLGHIAGDCVLREVSDTIGRSIRRSDLLGRWGGEEFIVLMHECDLKQSGQVAEKVRLAIENGHYGVGARDLHITVSIGVTVIKDSDNVDDLINRADKALYKAKNGGRNRVETA